MIEAMGGVNWASLSPALSLLVSACIVLMFQVFIKESKVSALLSLFAVIIAGVFNWHIFASAQAGELMSSFNLKYLGDIAASGMTFAILIGTALAIMISFDYLGRTDLDHAEYYPLILLSTCGAIIMVSAADFIVMVLGLEIMSLAVYVLSAWRQGARESEEAGMKYFLLGAFASAFFIYGIALMYGATGYFDFFNVSLALFADGFDQILLATLGGMMIIVGLGFKVAFVPFHQWAPDVYTGAPTTVTAFMSIVVKAAAFGALLRVASLIFPGLAPIVLQILVLVVALTMIVGNAAALMQRGLKRMLAYSAVAHAGYLGLAVLAAEPLGFKAAIWYLTSYGFMNIGAFAVLTLMGDKNDKGDDLDRFSGLAKTRPALAVAMSIFLLSLAGIPLFAGFIGKVLVFQAAINAGLIGLAVVGIMTSIVAAVYYIRPIAYMFFRDAEYPAPQTESGMTRLAIILAVIGTLAFGILPSWWYNLLDFSQSLTVGL